jgi:phage gp36-like protein
MYCTPEDVRKMIKDEVIHTILGIDYIEDEQKREELILPVIEEAISDADGEIDGYLNKRYPTPLQNVPKIINKLSKDIAIFNVYSRMGIDEDDRENTLLIRYKNAIKFLENVAKGTVDIGIENQSKKANTSFKITSNTKIFSRNNMRGM